MMKKVKKVKKVKVLSLVLVLALMASGIFAGCSGGSPQKESTIAQTSQQTEQSKATETQKPVPPVKIRMFRPGNVLDPKKDPVLLELQKRTNTEIEILTTPWSETEQRLMVLINSKEELDFTTHLNFRSPLQQWAKEGMFNALDGAISKETHPYITLATSSDTFRPLKVEGKAYYVPMLYPGYNWALSIRQDWLDAVGMKMPTTVEEFYEVLKAFKEKDPDGNKVDDTIGYQLEGGNAITRSMLPLLMPFGVSNWRISEKPIAYKDGKLIHEYTTQGCKDGLKFINKLYREGLINTDFPTMKDLPSTCAKYFNADKAGAQWTPTDFVQQLLTVKPDIKVEFVKPLKAKGYEFTGFRGMNYIGFMGFPATGKNFKKALELFEYVTSREGRELMVCGIKGKHYTELSKDGLYDRNKAEWEKDYDIKAYGYSHPLWGNFMTFVHGYIPVKEFGTLEEAVKNSEIWVDKDEYANSKWNMKTALKNAAIYGGWENPLMTVEFPELSDIATKLETQVKNVFWAKMVMSKTDDEFEKNWKDYLAEWQKVGGDQYMQTYQDYYDKYIKK